MPSGKKATYVVVDIETTGMRAGHHRVIDIGIIRIENGVVVARYETLLNPGIPIPAMSTEVSGITNEMVATAPVFEDVALTILEHCKDAIFVAHNASFDYGFIKAEFARIGIPFKAPVLCTVKLSRALYPMQRTHNLDAVIMRHGLVCDARHRAMADADVLVQFLEHAQASWGQQVLRSHIDAIVFAEDAATLIDRKKLADLPDTPGVYFFYGKDREILYIGKSKNIRTRVRSHFSDTTSRKEVRLCVETAHVETETTTGELGALLYESYLIKAHAPHYNRALRRTKRLVVAKRSLDAQGYATVALESYDDTPPTATIVGMFRTMTQAKQKLRTLATEHGLCQKLLGLEKGTSCFGYQLQSCKGACIGKESPTDYNARFDTAFRQRAIKAWPFAGPIIIEEKGATQYTGTVFFVDEWRLVKSYTYDHNDWSEFITGTTTFDYDMYKILARYIMHSSNKHSIRVLSRADYVRTMQEFDRQHEAVVTW